MHVIVKARHMTLTPALKAHAEEKLGRSVMRVFDRPACQVEIELTDLGAKDGDTKECRVLVFVPKGKTINITEVTDNMYKAIDLAHDRLLQQVKRERGRRHNPHRQRLQAREMREQVARENLTVGLEPWEREVAEFEQSTMRA
jgi:putative sigma-54 modulation protein